MDEDEHRTASHVICARTPDSVDDVDEAGYLDANPDVRRAGMSAREHFIQAGRAEGRLQFANQDRVAKMRERKLESLRFRRQPAPRSYGQPANFLTPEIVSEFGIPEAPPVSANQYGGPFIEEIRSNPESLCLDVGAGLRHSCFSNVVNTEIYPSISTDVLCVGEDLPFESEQFDYVICAAVLEHTRRPWEVAREICRVLKAGGKVLVDYPFLQSVHGYPHHYFNATPQGAISLFEAYCDILTSTIEPNNHPIQSIFWFLMIWRSGLEGADREAFDKLTVGEILSVPPEAQLGAAYCRNLSEHVKRIIPAGSTLIARRKHDCARSVNEPLAQFLTKGRVQALLHSTSWWITRSLRKLRGLFGQ
jgi:SAM-dependent methyltransferase